MIFFLFEVLLIFVWLPHHSKDDHINVVNRYELVGYDKAVL